MTFEEEINELEKLEFEDDFTINKGTIPILFSACHTMIQNHENCTKLNEPYTKAISLFCNRKFNTYSIIKNNDTGVDSNKDNYDRYNVEMRRLIKTYGIEFGTLNNLSADFSTIKELEESFIENGLTKIIHNDPFKGGAITQGIYGIDNVEVIQLEINGKFRDYNNLILLQNLINALASFIKQYNEYINR